ncbi:hypothetical protein KW796_00195 [Candidatus Parcubacteria bacterium]|nr:hypothetical protein [Candidatus Parcubacteria bacterium]
MRIRLAVAVLAALASVSEAQGFAEGAPLVFSGPITKARFAKAIQDCDKAVLRPSCSAVIQKFEEVQKIQFTEGSNKQVQLADYVRSLSDRPCPTGAKFKTTEWVPGSGGQPGSLIIGYGDWGCTGSREIFLWDGDKPVFSLADGHMILDYRAPQVARVAQSGRGLARAAADTDTTRRVRPSEASSVIIKDRQEAPPRITQSPPGLNCWDLNGNGMADLLSEDTDGNGVINVSDCRGKDGQPGLPGPSGRVVKKGFPIWRTLGGIVLGVAGGALVCHNNPGYAGICPEKREPGNIDIGIDIDNHNGVTTAGFRWRVP